MTSCSEDERPSESSGDERTDCNDDDMILLPLRPEGEDRRFVDTCEWEWTKTICKGLFRELGRYYDELWFPTALHEWCMLYYQCNHVEDYWQRREEWLKGDDQVRVAVWTEVLMQRFQRDQEIRDRCADGGDDDRTDPARTLEMRRSLDEASERIVLKRMCKDELATRDPEQPSREERLRAETEAAEIALADPSDDPNWVEMRRRMRGSFASLNRARCEVSSELLVHMMIELCKHWRELSPVDPCHEIEPLLEKNIMREIRKFRLRLFGETPEVPECRAESHPESDECQEPEPDECEEPEPDECEKPVPNKRRREPVPNECRREPEPDKCQEPEPTREKPRPCPAPQPKRAKSKAPCKRGPATNKLAEARAKQAAARIRELENRK